MVKLVKLVLCTCVVCGGIASVLPDSSNERGIDFTIVTGIVAGQRIM